MKAILLFLLNTFTSSTFMVISWFLFYFGLKLPFFQSGLFAILVWITTFIFFRFLQQSRLLRRNKLTRREYKYIKDNIREAERKIQRLQKSFFRARSIDSWKVLFENLRIAKRIIQIVKNEPRRFFLADRFFFYHLDSSIEIAEKYTKLATQPIHDVEMRRFIEESKSALKELNGQLQEDLKSVLQHDVDHLQFELDVVKKQLQQSKR